MFGSGVGLSLTTIHVIPAASAMMQTEKTASRISCRTASTTDLE